MERESHITMFDVFETMVDRKKALFWRTSVLDKFAFAARAEDTVFIDVFVGASRPEGLVVELVDGLDEHGDSSKPGWWNAC